MRTISPVPGNDNIRYDPQSAAEYGTGVVFVSCDIGLKAFDSRDAKPLSDVPIATKEGRPEAFQVEKLPGSRRVQGLDYILVKGFGQGSSCKGHHPSRN